MQEIGLHLDNRRFFEQIRCVFKITSSPGRRFQFQRQIEFRGSIVEVLCWRRCNTIQLQARIGLIGSAKIDLEQRRPA